MLKITSRNEILNRRMARKEINYLLYKLFNCFFVSPKKPSKSKKFKKSKKLKKLKNFLLSKKKSFSSIRGLGKKKKYRFKIKKKRFFSKRQVLVFQFKRYSLD